MPETCIVLVPKKSSRFSSYCKKGSKIGKITYCAQRYGATLKCHENIQTLIP